MGCLKRGKSCKLGSFTCIIENHCLSVEFEKRMIQLFQRRGSTVISFRLSLTLIWSHKSAYAKLTKAPQ